MRQETPALTEVTHKNLSAIFAALRGTERAGASEFKRGSSKLIPLLPLRSPLWVSLTLARSPSKRTGKEIHGEVRVRQSKTETGLGLDI
jgi:hypothetical protein